MSILPQLAQNKGTVSSALGKSLAKKVLTGETAILAEAVTLLEHADKNVRAGAAKIIEQTAVGNPALVAEFMPRLLPALNAPEPQTRWMVIHTLGLCAALDTPTARAALPKAQEFINQQSGACLWGSTVKYLGYLGAASDANARAVFPLLEQVLRDIPKQTKSVLEAFLRMLDRVDDDTRDKIARYAETYAHDEKPSVQKMARRLQRKME